MNLKDQFNLLTRIIKQNGRALLIALLVLASFVPDNVILALVGDSNPLNAESSIVISQEEMVKGKTISAFNNNFRLIFPAATSTSGLALSAEIKLTQLNENIATPWNLNKVSHIYQFDFGRQNLPKTFKVEISYDEQQALAEYKQVFFYDRNSDSWKPLPTKDNQAKKYVSATVSMPYARLAVLSFPGVLVSGKASWYAYKGGLYTASPDFPKGSRLRVYNLANNKFVDVTVNDYGPERDKHPDRAVDLDKVAFKKIASTGAGIINVRVEPLEIKADSSGNLMGVPKGGASATPKLSAKNVLVVRESDGQVIFSKNSTSTVPLASLTKMVAVKTFLDIDNNRQRLAETVSYKVQDEKMNYNYCKPWESPKVKFKEGDKATVKDMIYSSLAGSFNNTVETLVRVSGVSRADFIKKMNDNAKAWGAKDTVFVEPTGLSPKNMTTAADYVAIIQKIATDNIIATASTIKKYSFKNINDQKPHTIYNTNDILDWSKYKITSSKTGYLEEAGYCLMTRFQAGKDSLIVLTMNAKSRTASFSETEQLMRYSAKLVSEGKVKAASVE